MEVRSTSSKSFHFWKAISLSVVILFGIHPLNMEASASRTTSVVLFGRRARRSNFEYFSTHTRMTQELCFDTMKSISQCPYEKNASLGLSSIHLRFGSERNSLFSRFLPPLW